MLSFLVIFRSGLLFLTIRLGRELANSGFTDIQSIAPEAKEAHPRPLIYLKQIRLCCSTHFAGQPTRKVVFTSPSPSSSLIWFTGESVGT
jgi:hypothetical protein